MSSITRFVKKNKNANAENKSVLHQQRSKFAQMFYSDSSSDEEGQVQQRSVLQQNNFVQRQQIHYSGQNWQQINNSMNQQQLPQITSNAKRITNTEYEQNTRRRQFQQKIEEAFEEENKQPQLQQQQPQQQQLQLQQPQQPQQPQLQQPQLQQQILPALQPTTIFQNQAAYQHQQVQHQQVQHQIRDEFGNLIQTTTIDKKLFDTITKCF